ncbi:hypothetical protein B0H11DRAFT_1730552 [Mycena galericulata]|nr:hypothetical protein B0H11DRAFT_1730552 [Mycena galericulata]
MEILYTTRSIISGSTPLAIISGGTFVPNDLDIYVPASEENSLLTLLETTLEFHTDSTIPGDELYGRRSCLKSIRWLTTTKNNKRLNIMTCMGDSALLAVFDFHSTIVMNFISAYGLYCAYPHLTIAKKGLPATSEFGRPRGRRIRTCFQKYTNRGYAIKETLNEHLPAIGHTCFVHPYCPLTIRTVYDGHAAFVRFRNPIQDSNIGGLIYDEKHSALWTLGGSACNHLGMHHNSFAQSLSLTVQSMVRANSGTHLNLTKPQPGGRI